MTIRWGIIGCGQVTELKSGPAFYKLPGSQLTYVMRRDRGKAEDYARRHNVRRFTDDAEALIRDPEVDVVYVATPPGSHLEYALAVARAGKPCYVEKPMARSATECRRMLDAFDAAGQPLFVAYYRRALPRFVKLKQLLESDAIGNVVGLQHTLCQPPRPKRVGPPAWRLEAEHSGGGLFVDLASHAIDLFDFLLGPIRSVAGYASNLGKQTLVEDSVVFSMSFDSGVVGSASYYFAANTHADRLELIGQRGQLGCSVFGSEPLELCNDEGSESIVVSHPDHVQQPLIASIVAELSGSGVSCPSRGETALRAAIVVDSVLHDYYGGRDDAFWRRPATWPGARR